MVASCLGDFFAFAARRSRARVEPAAEIRLSQSKAAELLAFLHRGKPGVFLLVAAESVNGIHHQRRLHADKRAHAGVAALQFLRDQPVLTFDIPAQP